MGYLYSDIKIKRIELDICSWRHFKENLKLFNLLMDNESEGFKDGIWALRLRFGPQNWDLGLKAAIWFSVWDEDR